MAYTDAMNSSPVNPIPMRDDEVNRFRELREIFEKFFVWLFGVLAFKATLQEEALFTAHPNVMIVMIFMIVLYFLLWLLGTMLPQRSVNFLIILVCLMVVIASVSSVLVFSTISSLLAWFSVMAWMGVLALIVYFVYQEFYSLVVRVILDYIKYLTDGYRMQTSRLPV
ncbi:hypothetical protein PHAVU_L001862 [Phaseolus vulgaris]|uniref:Transmembrane protein n=2 Tax=Phaseolus vulgaris TaxID=3885 RepID=V7BYI7_PHAVU|nr:hypothetical protein PHAVU_005G086700g [Phaseolus vulgaris]ESW21636.1 hypothetical protein PHAVU_005G086700g [Phaseolus vulgaris]